MKGNFVESNGSPEPNRQKPHLWISKKIRSLLLHTGYSFLANGLHRKCCIYACVCVCVCVLPGKETFLIFFQIKVHQCEIFSPFFRILFCHGFRLLPANIQCLKLPFRPQGKSCSPTVSSAVPCLCSVGQIWGGHCHAAGWR